MYMYMSHAHVTVRFHLRQHPTMVVYMYTQNKTGVEICRGGTIFQNDATQLRGRHIGPICHNGNILVPMGTISFKVPQSCFLFWRPQWSQKMTLPGVELDI